MSQLPTPGIPKPRVSGISSIAKSGLPAPGIRSRSMTGNGGQTPTIPTNPPVLPQTPSEKEIANGIKKPIGRISNAASMPVSPVAGLSKPSYGATKQPSSYSKASYSANGPRSSIGRPPSSASASSSRQGDRTVPVTPPRRQSTVYTPGSAVRIGSTPRSSVTSRSESRLSDAFTRDSSRASQRPLEVGDRVKIESLSLEGTLRFLGEIAGKPGHWAGVELSGQFAGKGKNDGSAAGVAYFSCPPKCGVFVASTKIAAIPMGPPSLRRPGSVASSLGRNTPSIASPTDTRQRKVSSAEASLMAQSKISAGSRASKYIGVTAKQLSTRDLGSVVKPPQTSPQKSLRLGSPPRPSGLGVTQTTPKAPRASLSLKPRPSVPSLTTPRPSRLQLGAAKNDMPPPPVPDKKPVTPTLSQASNDSSSMDEALPDMPNLTVSNGISPSPSRSGRSSIYATPSPEPSFHVMEMQRLQTLVQTLEAQNKELKQAASQEVTVPVNDGAKLRLEEQHAAAVQRASELEASLRTIERNGIEKQGKIEVLERLVMETKEDVAKARAEGEARIKEVKLKLEESETLVGSLKGLIEAKASAASENDANLAANQAEIEVLRGQVVRITNDLEQERKELGSHIDELRRAGQETIALYEERISAFEAERYDSEALVQALEEKLRVASYQPSPEELSKQASTAAQIDNETLKEQVTHLQQRISHLEDQLEDAQALVEREEEATKVRIARYKEKDTQRQQELEELRRLATSATTSDSAARTRVEELEEALRENTAALEDARAEIESLRTDLTNLENSTELSAEERAAARASQTSATEAKHLKALLDASKMETRATADQLVAAKSQSEEANLLIADLRDLVNSLEKERAELLKIQSKNKDDSKRNRDSSSSVSSRTKDDNLRDQIAGLKIMLQEVQKENSALANRCRSLESENKLLLGETEDLKDAIKTLEIAVDESIQREERMLEEEDGGEGSKDEPSQLQKSLRESRLELDTLRKKMADVEKRNAKTISELNKEVADLESLVEAKIYREDDLEREVEKLKDKVQRLQSKSSSKSSGADALAKSSSRSNHTRSSTVTQQTVVKEEPSTLVCEICEQTGHDIFSCPLLKDDENATASAPAADPYCVDCDTKGHSTVECPYAQDVF